MECCHAAFIGILGQRLQRSGEDPESSTRVGGDPVGLLGGWLTRTILLFLPFRRRPPP